MCPDCVDANFGLAETMMRLKQYKQAYDFYKKTAALARKASDSETFWKAKNGMQEASRYISLTR